MFLWVTLIFIIPNAAVYIARSFIKTGTQEALRFTFAELDREFMNKCSDARKTIKQPDSMTFWNMNSGDDGFMEVGGSSRSVYEYFREMYSFSEPLRIEYAEKKWAHQKEYLNKLFRQQRIAEYLALLSPSELYRNSVSALCRTDISSYTRFMDQTRRYREAFIRFFLEKKIFSSFAYFTREDPSSFMTIDQIVKIRSGDRFQTLREYQAWMNTHKDSLSPIFHVDIPGTNPLEYAPLDQSDVPKFRRETSSIAHDLKRTFPYLAGLALGCVLLFYLSFVSFTRYDAR
jgi:hypothetical protein